MSEIIDRTDLDELNRAINALDYEGIDGVERPIFYWGWYWRAVDFDADHVRLAYSSDSPPPWYYQTAEFLMLGVAWHGKRCGFCENNKWDYQEFRVDGEEWDELRRLIRVLIDEPDASDGIRIARAAAINHYMDGLAP